MYSASSFNSPAAWPSGWPEPVAPLPAAADINAQANSSGALPAYGAGAYVRMGQQGAAMAATPHQLICMLFDGVKTATLMARHHMAQGDTVAKGNALSKAINIIDNGLKASLDENAGGAQGAVLVGQLASLYDYVVQRLMLANRRNDPALIDEAERLLDNVSSAWRAVGHSEGQS